MTDCPDEMRLNAYHDGELSPADRDAVASHVVDCEACGAYVGGLRRVSAWMATAAGAVPGLSRMDRARLDRRVASVVGDGGLVRFGWELSAAAAAVLLAGSAWLTWSARRPAATTAEAAVPPWVAARTVAVADPTLPTAATAAAVTPAAAWYGVDSADGS